MPKQQHLDVFISSTSIDLPDHRKAVIDALISIGLFPDGMDHWPVPADKDPVELCHQKVREAELFVGIYAHRYGWRPGGEGTPSITEMEYDWAGEQGIPRFCFIMHDDHPWPRSSMELGASADLDAFKARVKQQVVGFFTDSNDLKAQVLAALALYAQKQDLSVLTPYLRHLYHDAMQSGLLRTLDPRTKDPAFQDRHVTVDQVYIPLDTLRSVFRDDDGHVLLDKPEIMEHLESVTGVRSSSPLGAMEAVDHYDRLVVLGDPGSGKSTFVNFLALGLTGHLLDPHSGWLARLEAQGWTHKALLPVHVILRDFAQDMGPTDEHGTAQSLINHIGRLLEGYGCGEALHAVKAVLARENQALLILDGLDEVPPERREAVRDAITDLMTAYPCRVVITCRILSYATPEWQIPGTDTVTLAPFDRPRIEHFIEAWYTASQSLGSTAPDVAQARIADLVGAVEDVRLRDMATNPMLLTVMAIVHNHRGTLPRETARLYHACVEILMLKWKPEVARHLREVLELTDENDLYRILWQIAYEAHERQGDREGAADIPKQEVITIAAEDHLRGDYAKAQAFCDYVEDRAGLLVGRGGADSKRRVYAFPHRTFQEYLAGCHVADQMDFPDLIDTLARAGANWRQVVLLSVGHMYFNRGDRNQPLFAVQYLLRGEPKSDADWQAVALAGEILLLIGLPALEKHKLGGDLLHLARERLAALVGGGHLPSVERAEAGRTLSELGDPRPGAGLRSDGVPDIAWSKPVPAGRFHMGGDPDAYNAWEGAEYELAYPFWMAQYPVTYVQYAAFIDAGGYTDACRECWTDEGWEWKKDATAPYHWNDPQWHIVNHPVVGVTWYEAYAYAQWLNKQPGVKPPDAPAAYVIRLARECEWEKAARYPDGRFFPWGNEWDPAKLNSREGGLQRTTAVGLYPDGKNLELGVYDLSGNVWEWCLTQWEDPYKSPDMENNDPAGKSARVVRGGSWPVARDYARAAFRGWDFPLSRYDLIGFRVICASPIS